MLLKWLQPKSNSFFLLFLFTFALTIHAPAEAATDTDATIALHEADLTECIDTALENNRRRPASRFAVEMAEAQHRQALAGYWPQISAKAGYQRVDQAQNFIFPATSMSMDPINTPMGPIPLNDINIPEQEVRLMDEDTYSVSVEGTWLLYDGGMRKGYREQTKGLVAMMKQDARRTDLEIIDSVKRYYYGAVLAAKLHQVGLDTLARMETTLNLTEIMYKEGSGQVKKTD